MNDYGAVTALSPWLRRDIEQLTDISQNVIFTGVL